MGHSAELAFALWATAQNLLKSYGPQRRIWLALWATAQNFVRRYGPRRRIIDHSAESLTTAQNHSKFIEKFATTFKGTVRQKFYISIMN
jgi:hypothetical protein